ncbi:MAG: lysoplasmalogenase [Deltaproteobacteria bacterium]|nr:MAG: lysoplasmalogenase [Deltaproteobacteria bacterium]
MICIILMFLALVILLVAEYRHLKTLIWLSKPAASTLFLFYAVSQGSLHHTYGKWILVALVLSWIGDVLLIKSDSKVFFQSGLVSFLLAHVAYILAFFHAGLSDVHQLIASGSYLLVGGVGFLISRWLMPYVKAKDSKMILPVWAYMIVISFMVLCAIEVTLQSGHRMVLVGAIVFYLSDIAVAREQFVQKSFINKLWGLPFYYAAQMMMASTITSLVR